MKIQLPLFIIIFLLSLCSASFAKKVEIKDAQTVAKNCYYEKINTTTKTDYQNISITGTFTTTSKSDPVYYIFNINNAGFVIVSADDVVYPVIGYSLENTYNDKNQPVNFISWMKHYEKEIIYARETKANSNDAIISQWKHYLTKPDINSSINNKTIIVKALLPCTWNQNQYYNDLCPVDANGPGGHVYAGCVATAMGQIMFYYRYPTTGQGSRSYSCPPYGILSANFGTTTYEWNSMIDNLISPNTAVAKLLYHCGVSVGMNYDSDGSGSYTIYAATALKNYFRYSFATYASRSNYSTSSWISMLKTQLNAKRPVFYSGNNGVSDGHAFVCDGYDDADNFHFNWGWSGLYNGYFSVDNLNPSTFQFSEDNQAVINIFPSVSYPSYCSGQTTLTNPVGTFEDGSGTSDYQNNSDCSWLIAPTGAYKVQLSFTSIGTETSNDKIFIYDGDSTSDPLLATYSGISLHPALTSTSGKMLVRFTSNGDTTSTGWRAKYSTIYPTYCTTMTELTDGSGNFSDGSDSGSYYNNNTNCKWRIHPSGATSITIGFTSFNTELTNDIVKVYDESQSPSVLLATYSGTSLPPTNTYSTGQILVMFTSNASVSAQGWEAFYSSNVAGINDPELAGINIYPNPAENLLNISFNSSSTEINISLTTMTGQSVFTNTIENFSGKYTKTIDLAGIAKGIYFLKIVSEKGTVNKKVVVE